MKAPFIWFGGKRRVADLVWAGLCDVDNYVEPFAGSLAVLLERPAWHTGRCETVNDADSMLANFWRALAADPDAVAHYADWPVNETDLFARHLWLVNTGRERIEAMESDPDFYDAKVAGWWVWGLNAWIGSGWCSGTGPWINDEASKRPHLGDAGRGVNRQLPHLGNAGQGVNRKLPHLGDAGRGVNQPPGEGAFDSGGSGAPANPWDRSLCVDGERPLYGYMRALAARLRDVRVCCGDWARIVTDGALNYGATVGVFLDPPYLGDVRTKDLYSVDDHTIATQVREWAVAHGDNPRLRIVLAGYSDEHEAHMPPTWRTHAYSASLAYGTGRDRLGGEVGNGLNRHKERLWFSPHCVRPGSTLLDLLEAPA